VFDGRGTTTSGGATITSYSWSFNDGTADGSGGSVTHTFPTANTYLVRLTVVDSQGRIGTTNVTVSVP